MRRTNDPSIHEQNNAMNCTHNKNKSIPLESAVQKSSGKDGGFMLTANLEDS